MDWIQFLEDNNIAYVTRGPNTKRGEVSVACAWCGDDDPSQHLGISLTAENWGCLRNVSHRGRLPYKLIAALLGCSIPQARLVAAQYSRPDPESLDQCLVALTGTSGHANPDEGYTEPLLMPPEFRQIQRNGSTSRFWRYLANRGFDNVASLCELYGLMCCLTGRWKDRIIVPIMQNGELIAWTGRALQNPMNAPRYLSSSEAIKTSIFNEDELSAGGSILFITEGPFDALKLDYYGRQYGARATCTFGTSISIDQISILNGLRHLFDKVILVFDVDAVEPAFLAGDWLRGVSVVSLPHGVEDPGAMTEGEIRHFISYHSVA